VTGSVSLALYKGNLTVTGRESAHGLYRHDLASFAAGSYDHADATGFINLYGLPEQVRALSQAEG
jgi:argininosuccinate synthase